MKRLILVLVEDQYYIYSIYNFYLQLQGRELLKNEEEKEDFRVRMKISTLFLTSAVILSALLIPTVLAEKPTDVSGTWAWDATDFSFKYAGGVTFMSATEHDTFSDGTFIGSGVGPFTVRVDPNGFMTGRGRTTFTGEVMDKEGTLVIQWTGNTKNDMGYWWFKWVIISGTGELANLRGSGYCWGPGPSGVTMYGKIHFDPKLTG